MNDQICWDSSLVKKFSSSNHFKLLNQLRSEVKKYPLIKKKNLSSNIINNNKTIVSVDLDNSKNTIKNNPNSTKSSTVSFNNSKNFSIYNNITKNRSADQEEHIFIEEKKSNDNNSSSSFKDRLDQIDMK